MGTKKDTVTDFDVCEDCFWLAMTGDATHFDGAYCEPEASERHQACSEGLDEMVSEYGRGHFSHDEEGDREFDRCQCESCGLMDEGTRKRLQWVEVGG